MIQRNYKNLTLYVLFVAVVFSLSHSVHAGTIVRPSQSFGTLRSGLVGYWSFDAGDVAKNTAYDRSGQGNNGTLTNGPTPAAGKLGQALSFDGSNDYVGAGALDVVGNITISAWVYPRSYGGASKGRIVDNSLNVAGYKFVINNVDTTNGYVFAANGVDSLAPNSATFNVWQHVVAVCDTVSVRIYVNGILKSTSAPNCPATSNTSLHIGDSLNLAPRQFDGLIDDVRIYNRALSSDEIKRLYSMGGSKLQTSRKGGSSLDQGLVGYWSFDAGDMAKNTAYDRSGQNNTGTLTNGPKRVVGKLGQALNFDGVNDALNTDSTITFTSSDFSVSMWIYPRNLAGGDEMVGMSTGISGKDWIAPDLTKVRSKFFGHLNANVTTNPSFVNNEWQHFVLTRTTANTTITVYRNGINVGSASEGGVNAFHINSIGGASIDSDYWQGQIDDVRIYNRALSPDEIKRLYSMGR
ncbi:MAG: hypothetical protein A3C84_01945 [Candidatus Ryanbacteria bacterium RIFCSPHIGHO2_02_FULL_48_12]|uniref:LamG-like jellyroll fold domain-containing protein n=1 Tax=Candidatus Ryanbacteria bacterium RIFCSPHIGHO2_01_FULL_48_27 TaxID=1802115 RepID=A0A1G2FZJ3_9BACT|nr:MAG: hypothetical protein A2756_04075 [Candidatus Ryanbacteria bacterium RIFCSPHIGHO2_01_FULL_48_27]OGZ49348.1 MAG: hypothetical protein A3C84_01945 [Candidatus Ryanbacteria bacterium RIFCSPHIGHO2_02_FULL_48_12]